MKKRFWKYLAWGMGLFLVVAGLAVIAASKTGRPSQRRMKLAERIRVRVPADKADQGWRFWVPIGVSDRFQKLEGLSVETSRPYRITRDSEYGNSTLYFEGRTPGDFQINLRYWATRYEQNGWDGPAIGDSEKPPAVPQELGPHLRPRGLVVHDETVRALARRLTRGIRDPLERARALYEYVRTHVRYDTSGAGWGNGDVAYVCREKRGNCTDFHSLFIALCQAGGIPARFLIGYPLPEPGPRGFLARLGLRRAGPSKLEKPYHCWAEFYTPERGWIPVDISEAWKHPEKAGYYFGRLDADRVQVARGREIRLSPPQSGRPLNYLVRPYLEVDGRPAGDFQHERWFQEY